MTYLYIDTETYCALPIERGNDLYCRAATCIIVTYAFGELPVRIWFPETEPMPDDLKLYISDPTCIFVAHNAQFDRSILRYGLKIVLPALSIYGDVFRWRCTRAQAYAHGLPGALEGLGRVLRLDEDHAKLADDGKLIHTFCIPVSGRRIMPADAPVEWARFCNYALRDTEALREIHRRLPTSNYSGNHIVAWTVSELINNRGFGFDVRLATAAVDFLADAKVQSSEAVMKLTGLEVHAATQRNRLLAFLRERLNIDIESLRAAEVREWLESDDLHPVARMLLEQRLEAGKSSGAKYNRGLQMLGPGNRQRHTQQFNGAGRTGRDSGRGFQPHNMTRPVLSVQRETGRIELVPVKAKYIDEVILPGIMNKRALCNTLVYGGPHEAAALAMRHVITAAPGNHMVVGDFKNIESVITAWIANEEFELVAFREAFADTKDKSKDVYNLQWSRLFGMRPQDVNETERQGSKVVKLAFGFGGGVGALVTMAAGYQLELEPLADIVLPRATPEQLHKAAKAYRRALARCEDWGLPEKVYIACDVLKQAYRATNSRIHQLKLDVDKAVKDAVREPNQRTYRVGRCDIWCNGSYLIIQLPSGRRLLYANPTLQKEVIPDPEGGEPWTTYNVWYSTARGKQWRREKSWSGLFVENIVQAIANDVLRAASERVHLDTLSVPAIRAYLDTLPEWERTAICLRVHDEIALDVPVGSYPEARLAQQMTKLEPWMEGLPLAADTWENFRYGKR